ncbi:MAG: alpha-L-fucosidase, partial [Chitinophagaceae bacterium]
YMQGSRQYEYHVKKYGHPSKFGFKDIIPTWKAERFDPDYLVGLYKNAGAKYFVSMGVHHDNFDLLNSKYTRWNAVNMGPKRDIVGEFQQAAKKHGLRFGVSDHLWISWKWFSTSHGSDQEGPLKSLSYDGVQPELFDLYHDVKKIYTHLEWNENGIPESWKKEWFRRIKDLTDKYHPDLLYCDGAIPFEEYGLNIVANLYNTDFHKNKGNIEAVYTSNRQEDSVKGTCVLDVERGLVNSIWPRPWQTDTCIGNWHYDLTAIYKKPKTIIDMLVDIVSRNGNLLLNFPLPSSGMLDFEELEILAAITGWMKINEEAIYATRPWKIFGYGPTTDTETNATDTSFNEKSRKALTAADIRFTKKGKILYAFFMGWAVAPLVIKALGTTSQYNPSKIEQVSLLGFDGTLAWEQEVDGLKVTLPDNKPCDYGCALKILLA